MADAIIHGNQNTTKLINQLKASSTQYPVLTKEQEREMIEAHADDRDKLNFLLFMHNIRTVFNQAKAYISRTNDYDSLVQNGMLGLAEAVRRFDPSRNIKFCTYASTWVHKYLSMPYYTAQFKLDLRTVSINSPAPTADGDSISAEDTLENCVQSMMDPSMCRDDLSVENQISVGERAEICDDIYKWVDSDSSLSATDRAVFKEMFIDREKARDIAERHNLDAAVVAEIRRRVLSLCRDRLEQKYSITSYADIA